MSRTLKIRTLKLFHFVGSVAMFVGFWYMFFLGRYNTDEREWSQIALAFIYAALMFLLNRIYDSYSIGYRGASENAYSQTISDFFSLSLVWIISMMMYRTFVSPLPLLALLAAQVAWNILWCVFAKYIYSKLYKNRKTIIVYRDEDDLERISEIYRFKNKFDVKKQIKCPDDYKELEEELEGFEAVVVSGVNADLRNGIAKFCVENKVKGYFVPHVGDIIMQGAGYMQSFYIPVLNVKGANPTPEYSFVKRLFDISASALALILLSPIFFVTALAIKINDGGPVFYKQIRLTKNRREFRILKFRSMRVDAEKDGVARLSSGQADDRITSVGRIIRACRIDELPQLWNIFVGDMSIVGPRPERPEISEQYEEDMPAFGLRLQVKAGLTGNAQVYGKYNASPHDKLIMDLMYINRMSVLEDLKIIFATVRILFKKESTEGVEVGKVTAKV